MEWRIGESMARSAIMENTNPGWHAFKSLTLLHSHMYSALHCRLHKIALIDSAVAYFSGIPRRISGGFQQYVTHNDS